MTPEDAQHVLHCATWDDDGTFIMLRLGIDPGRERIAHLRRAIFVLWLHWKDQTALPFAISENAAQIMRMRPEADYNLKRADCLREDLVEDLNRLEYGAYCLLIGSRAEADVGRNGKQWQG